ncbi:MAG: hypothetical protein FJY92_05525 [Candidatus Hydrogenedentes bacterium]|nr:hypothetical protein [Candidatus Hydrogenedentota bacterium]
MSDTIARLLCSSISTAMALPLATLPLLAGCNGPGEGTVQAPVDTAATAPGPGQVPTPGAVVAYPPEPIAYFGKGAPWRQELLADTLWSNFENREEGRLESAAQGWSVYPSADAAERVKRSPIPEQLGRFTLEFIQRSDETYVTQTSFPLNVEIEKAFVSAHVEALCSQPNEFGVVIALPYQGASVEIGAAHSGSGTWENVEIRAPLFGPVLSGPLTMKLVKRGTAPCTAQVRSASLLVDVADGKAGPPADLLDNGDFESYPFTQSYYPWSIDRWGGPGGDCTLAPVPDRWGVSFSPPTEGGAVRIAQPIRGLSQANLGEKLRASAAGIASGDVALVIAIRSMKDGKVWEEHTSRTVHPGDGAWHDMTVSVTLPPDRLPDAVYVDVYRKSVTSGPVMVDNVRLTRSKG